MRVGDWVASGLCAAFGVSVLSCLGPTEIVLELSTNVSCGSAKGTTISLGKPGDDNDGITTETNDCSNDGGIGTLVVLPRTSPDDELGVRVVLGVANAAESCGPPVFKGCIVARRSLRYVVHQPLKLPIELDENCLDNPCDPNTTCVSGECVSVDAGVCDEAGVCVVPVDAGRPADAGDGGACQQGSAVVTSGTPVSTPRIARTQNGYAIAWSHLDTNNLPEIDAEELSGAGAVLNPKVILPLTNAPNMVLGPLGSDGTNYALVRSSTLSLYADVFTPAGAFVGADQGVSGYAVPTLGVVFDGQRYVIAAVASNATAVFEFNGTTLGGGNGAVSAASVSGPRLTWGPAGSVWITAHDAANCYSTSCSLTGSDYTCTTPLGLTTCQALMIAQNGSDYASAEVSNNVLSVTVGGNTLNLGALDYFEGFEILSAGPLGFRVIARTGGGLASFVMDKSTTAAPAPSWIVSNLGNSTPSMGFDAVADGPNSAGYGVVYWQNGTTATVSFQHRCQ